MSDTGRQTIITPEDLGPKSVFVINDIDLVVPPSQITINKEDLVYRWRTLRTKAATKIPTGHGRVDVHVTMYFPFSQILALHRLIVEFRHSPFCYIDNRYLRESIVPDWPTHQNMAFTMTGLAVRPMPGSSDTWVCELDLIWFNYFPYMHNWLYRQDWFTNPIYAGTEHDESYYTHYTMGWEIDHETYEKIHRPRAVGESFGDASIEATRRAGMLDALYTGGYEQLTDEYSLIQRGYRDKGKKTIYEMEIGHAGVEWDLVPLPDNMMPSRIVTQPKNSRIYVRYINHLQRDALWKNFGIDVEADLIEYADPALHRGTDVNWGAFFSLIGTEKGLETWGLHTNHVPRDLQRNWIKKMSQHNHGIKFTFHALTEIRFPQGWIDKTENMKNEAIGNFAKRLGNITYRQDYLESYRLIESTDGSELAIPVLGGKFRITSGFGPRKAPKDGASTNHKGIDIGVQIGVPVLAPEDGHVISAKLLKDYPNNAGNRVHFRALDGGKWSFMHLDTIVVSDNQFVAKGQMIGTSGNTGNSTGPHLHLEYTAPGKAEQMDPTEKLAELLYVDNIATPLLDPRPPTNFVEAIAPELQGADREKEVARTEAQEELEISDEEREALEEMLSLLDAEGWKYFDRDTTVLNIWEKLINLQIAHSGLDFLNGGDAPERFIQEGVVLTNVGGALTHIVANLPILSNEFPTQQHLGSIEPQYTFEFAVLDDQGDLEGISKMAQFLQGMRSLLQKNARTFRPVTDGWAVATDTFITRLFGTYTENDIREYREGDRVVDLLVKKRTVVSNSSSGTVEGNPGLSFIMLNVEETNPYEPESLKSTAPLLEAKEEARSEILQAIYKLDVIEEYKKLLLPILVAQQVGGNTGLPGSEDYGKFHLDVYYPSTLDAALVRGLNTFILEENGNQYLLIKKTDNELEYLLNGLTDENGNPIQKKTIRNVLGPIDNAQFLLDGETSAPVWTSKYYGERDILQDPAMDLADGLVGLVGADTAAEYFKIPFTAPFSEARTAGDEDWVQAIESGRGLPLGIGSANQVDRVYYDVSSILNENPELGLIPIETIMDYWIAVHEIVHTGNRIFAEELTGGEPNSKIVEELYGLPFKNRMWQSWQEYLKAFVLVTPVFFANPSIASFIPGIEPYSGSDALENLQTRIPGWPLPGTAALHRREGEARQESSWPEAIAFDMSNPDDAREVFAIRTAADGWQGAFGLPVGGLLTLDDKLLGYFKSTLGASVSGNVDVATYWRDAHDEAIRRLVNTYMSKLPLAISVPDYIKDKYNTLFGDLIGNNGDETQKVPALATMHEALGINADSCGNFTALRSTGSPWFQVSENDPFAIYRGPNGNEGVSQDTRYRRGGGIGGTEVALAPFTAVPVALTNSVLGFLDTDLESFIEAKLLGGDPKLIEYLYPKQQIGNPLNSEFKYPVNLGEEALKIRYIKSLLSTIADDVLFNPDMLRAFGLEHLALVDRQSSFRGSECYPDLELPGHPYYGDSFQVYPDFYMWNIYTDGSALSVEDQQKIYTQLEGVVTNCYQSMKQLQDGRKWKENQDKVLGEPSVDDPIQLSTMITPEAADGGREAAGPSHAAFDDVSDQARASIDVFDDKLRKKVGGKKALNYGVGVRDWGNGIRLSNVEGSYGKGAGIHYSARVGKGLYEDLERKVLDIEKMFGSRAGFLNQYPDEKNLPEIATRAKGTNHEPPIEYVHSFDLDNLQRLAKDSAKDLLSQKMTLRRAYPTFKLFFVEEDEFESRFLNFDDFYSYNAVKEFTVVQSRKLPADHAVITLQNVSGTLDGTKRNSIVDLDYYDDTAEEKLKAGVDQGSALGGNPITKDTAQDQPFGAVILRPGLNVQLRCGYANDPDNLHVLLSGRVVDVSWNKTGDLAEIMVQSFGTELIQAVKGTARNGAVHSYKSTHELLGSMMLEPEVVHFGRWEFGQLFQIGESSDHRLDFTDYSREGFMGRFRTTNALTGWVMNHPWATLAVATGLTAANFFPIGRVFGGSRIAAGMLGKFGLATPLGRTGLTKALTKGATRAGISLTDDAGKAAALSREGVQALTATANRSLQSTYNLALKKAGSKTFQTLLKGKWAAYQRALMRANTSTQILESSLKMEKYLQTAIFKGQWMSKPWAAGAQLFSWGSYGKQPLSTAFNIFLTGPVKVAAGLAAIGLTADLILRPILDLTYKHTVGKVRKFFSRTQAHLLLTPQDDNLYPPHPKDYMELDRGKIDRMIEGLLVTGSRILFQDDAPGRFAYGLWEPDEFLSKKVDPAACTYEIVTSTIWQIFHEMSLRHPGWIYAPRPYGTKFQYTMFFGVPSQRYWERPASNLFIDRMNRLRRYLEKPGSHQTDNAFSINDVEFRALYGDEVYEELKARIEYPARQEYENSPLKKHGIDIEPAIAAMTEQQLPDQMTSLVLREYLRGLNLRFVPFRRYHMFSSERDIIWNSIMSSEQAVTNAVDVTYWSTLDHKATEHDGHDTEGKIQTAVFKAHAFIPEHQLRIAPVRWPNCNSYQMAMRYGMGELLHRMRDMYRGELLVLGNPRIRPWDIGILVDSYNDMVGPIEVEQVVHTFSHETGFITEIKPSAVVFANEISGYPMVTAMKMFALAIKDIEERYGGIRAEDGEDPNNPGVGFLGTLADLVNRWGARGADFNSFTDEKYNRLFGEEGASLDKIFGSNPPNTETIDNALDQAELSAKFVLGGIGATSMAVGLASTITGTVVAGDAFVKALSQVGPTSFGTFGERVSKSGKVAKTLMKSPLALAGGAATVGGLALGLSGYGAMYAAKKMDFPSAIWLIGGPILMLHCLRNEAITLVPLIKNGHPIVSGLSYNDPSMLWNDFRGELNRWVDDTLGGTRDMIGLYQRYGSAIWNRLNSDELADMTGEGIGFLPPGGGQ